MLSGGCSAIPTPITRKPPRPALPAPGPPARLGGAVRVRLCHHACRRGLEPRRFAHYLHIRSTLDTAAAYGLAPATGTYQRKVLGPSAFDTIIAMWLPLAWSLNMVNRSMGKPDLYPFVLPGAVLEKMRLVHRVLDETASAADDD